MAEPTEQDREQAWAITKDWYHGRGDAPEPLVEAIATALHEREEQTRQEVWGEAIKVAQYALEPKDES